MPTGYTSTIAEGISFKDFAIKCARGFGALVELRDDPNAEIPSEFKPSDYHTNEIKKAKKELEKINNITLEEAKILIKKEYDDEIKYTKQINEEKKEINNKYADMLKKIICWQPPTKDHENLKKFMIEQVQLSITYDCGIQPLPSYNLMSPKKWIEKNKSIYKDSIKRHSEGLKQEIDSCKKRTEWVQKLLGSL